VSRVGESIVAPLDAARWAAVKRAIEQIDELRDGGHHTAAAVMAAHAGTWLSELARDAHLPDFEAALRMRLVTDVEPKLSHEYDLREDP
jgi:hypothetical protein